MASKKRLVCDKTEMVGVAYLTSETKKGMSKRKLLRFSLIYDEIKYIKLEKYEEKKLFKKIPSERILIFERKSPEPYEITRINESEYFDEYIKDIKEFAERNRIKLEGF